MSVRVLVRFIGFDKKFHNSEFWMVLEEGTSLSDLFNHLQEEGIEIPEREYSILLNGKFIDMKMAQKTQLQNLDQITVIPLLGGGNSNQIYNTTLSFLDFKLKELLHIESEFYLSQF